MALRLVNKINRQFIKNVSRSMSTPRDAVDVESKQEDVRPKTNDSLPPVQYQVCRPRKTPVTRFHNEAQNEADAAKQYVALQHLQPALLPEYYTPPLEIHSSICPEPLSEADKQSSQIRRFEESKTCMNVTLPLRAPKLASPFPSPVKVMESHTVSDQEKAEQMLAEAKVYKGVSTNQTRHQHMMKQFRSFRTYSTHNEKSEEKACPKISKKKDQRGCKKVEAPPCIAPKTISCKRDKIRVECKKKEAPYPSYSESCHEEPLEKPSECKMCPWKPEEHPTFKPPKKNFHTCSGRFLPKKGECDEPPGRNKKSICTEEEEKNKDKKKKKKPKKKCAPGLFAPMEFHDPNSNLNYGLESQGRKVYVQTIKPKLRKSKKPRKNSGLDDDIALWLDSVKPIATSSEPNVFAEDSLDMFTATSDHSNVGVGNKPPCKKFPFKIQDFGYEKKRPPAATKVGNKCPKKKSRRMIQDCPKEDDKEKCRTSAREQYSMLASKRDEDDEKQRRCPRVNLGTCKENEIEDDDPCNVKRRGNTWNCPKDLLKKKKRKNPKSKKTSGTETSIPLSSQVKTIDSTSRL